MVRRWLLTGVMVGMFGGTASGEPAPTGLNGLDRELGTTGRVGVYAPRSSTEIQPAAPEADTAARTPELRADDHDDPNGADRAASLSDEELRRTDAGVTACRVEVARRRQVAPKKVAAKEVVVRFTVEPSGHVRDAEAISALNTDLEIAACAKRVVSDWVFARHPGGAVSAQRTYRFP